MPLVAREVAEGADLEIPPLHTKILVAYIEWDPETRLYAGIVPGLPGAHTQGVTLSELRKNLSEVLELCLEEYGGNIEELPKFVDTWYIEVAG